MQELLDASKAWWRVRQGRVADRRRCPASVALGVTTASYLQVATTKVCSTASPLDLLPRPVPERAQDID